MFLLQVFQSTRSVTVTWWGSHHQFVQSCYNNCYYKYIAALTRASCDCIVMVALEQPWLDKIQRATDLDKFKKLFGLSLLRGRDKNTYMRAIACSLIEHGYIEIGDNADLANLTRQQLKTMKNINSSLFITVLLLLSFS